jgi:hypothetical protein
MSINTAPMTAANPLSGLDPADYFAAKLRSKYAEHITGELVLPPKQETIVPCPMN